MLTKPEWDTYWEIVEREAEEKDPKGLQRRRDALRDEQKMVQKTIKMLMDGVAQWEKRNDELDREIELVDAEKDRLWDAWFAARKAVGR